MKVTLVKGRMANMHQRKTGANSWEITIQKYLQEMVWVFYLIISHFLAILAILVSDCLVGLTIILFHRNLTSPNLMERILEHGD